MRGVSTTRAHSQPSTSWAPCWHRWKLCPDRPQPVTIRHAIPARRGRSTAAAPARLYTPRRCPCAPGVIRPAKMDSAPCAAVTAHSMQRATRNVQHATCNVQCVACNGQHARCIIQHAAYNTQHAAWNHRFRPIPCRSTPKSGGARQSRLTTDHSCARTGRTLACAHGPWPLPVCHVCRPERASELARPAHGTGSCAGLSRALIASQLRAVRCRSRRRAAADGRAHRAVQGHEKLARHVHAGEHRR